MRQVLRCWPGVIALVGLLALVACAAQAQPTPTKAPAPKPAVAPIPTAAAPAPKAAEKKPLKKVTLVQSTESLSFATPFLTKDKGFFEEEGLDVEIVITGGGPKAIAAVLGDSAQLAAVAAENAIQATAKGQPIATVATISNQITSNVVISKAMATKKGVGRDSPLADKLKALKGLKIGVASIGSGPHSILTYLFSQAGIDPEREVSFTALGQMAPMLAALEKGAIDAFATGSPAPEMAEMAGYGVPLIYLTKGEVPELNGILFVVLAVKRDYLEKNQETVVAATRAIWKAQKYLRDDKLGAREVLRKRFAQTDPKVFDAGYETTYDAWAKDPVVTPEGLKKAIDLVNQTKAKADPPIQFDYDRFVAKDIVALAKR